MRNALLGEKPEETRAAGVRDMTAATRAAETRRELAIKSQKIKIRVSYSWCKVATMGPALGAMVNHFKIFNPKARFSPQYVGNGGRWDGYVSFVNEKDGSFGIGMLPEVVAWLEQRGVPYELVECRQDIRPARKYIWDWNDFELRPEQATAVSNMKKSGIGIVKAQMGFGKTLVFLKLVQELGLNTLITVPSSDLMRQTYERAKKAIVGATVGMYGDGIVPPEGSRIVIATQQTLVSLYKKVGKAKFIEAFAVFDVLISDECHKIVSGGEITKAWGTIMQIPAAYRFGVSATPFDDPNGISAWYLRQSFGTLIFNMSAVESQERGITVPFKVYSFRLSYPPHYGMEFHGGPDDEDKSWATAWQEAYMNYIVGNKTRNAHIIGVVKRLIAKNHKVLVVAQSIPHNDLLTTEIRKALGYDIVSQFHGKSRKRVDVLNEFTKIRGPSVLVASSIANEGLDIKDITAIVVATAGKSFYQVVQRIGRGLRTFEGKKELLVVDYDDSGLGEWFHKHYRERIRRYKELGGEIKVVKE